MKGIESIEEEMKVLDEYLDYKIKHYRVQDFKAKRDIDEARYVTKDWLNQWFGRACSDCGDTFRYETVNGRGKSNLTADRPGANNIQAHHIDNIAPLCITCNCIKSTR